MDRGNDLQNTFVVGFMYSYGFSEVVLIEKYNPEWQRGLLNGVGGKVKEKETAMEAMVREFEEETGVYETGWKIFCTLNFMSGIVYFYKCVGDVSKVKSVGNEIVRVCSFNNISNIDVVPNLKWLVPLGRSSDYLLSFAYDGFFYRPK